MLRKAGRLIPSYRGATPFIPGMVRCTKYDTGGGCWPGGHIRVILAP